jgi:S-adenosylmethionine-diacylgycerolhomoserine-N-methlytransferase
MRHSTKARKSLPASAVLRPLDVSREMLGGAAASITRAMLSSCIAVAHADATAFDPLALFGRARFGRVMPPHAMDPSEKGPGYGFNLVLRALIEIFQ